jgi:hypothetical protein
MTEAVIAPAGALLDEAARRRLFRGAILVQERVPAMVRLCRNAGHMLGNAFHPHPPERAHDVLAPVDYVGRVNALRAAFRRDSGVRHLFETLFRQLGADADDIFRDRYLLRAVPPDAAHQRPPCDPLAPHRDTWGSNVYQQVNLWAPILPVEAANTMNLYPAYWNRPVANTSGDWDLDDLRAHIGTGRRPDYPRLPVAAEDINPAGAVPVVIRPGDVLAFSGAHLHASSAAGAQHPRFSIDFRAASLADVRAGAGAPNIDGAAPRIAWDWFKGLADGRSLADAVIAPPALSLSGPA